MDSRVLFLICLRVFLRLNLSRSVCYSSGHEEGELIVEGLLNISWGLRRPIRLQMQDDNERFHFVCAGMWGSESMHSSRWVGLSSVDGLGTEEETPLLLRTRSDTSIITMQRRSKTHSSGDLQQERRHRFSINGHFYNHKSFLFSDIGLHPAYGSVTNVRVNTNICIIFLQVENKTDEFALYVVHESGERTKFKDTEYPLVSRVLHGPCEKIAKIFILERDLGEEVTYDVAQYIKFEMSVLDSFVKRLKEEEEREILKLTRKYVILHQCYCSCYSFILE
uniref:Ras association domain family member 4a n=1 Tax=Electrophorus electricus TaxID=8005 RepID=A0A4W4DM20_ELEEL